MKRMILALACAAALASAIPAQGATSGALEYRGIIDFSKSIADFPAWPNGVTSCP
jgi:hypothetical protein